MKILESLVPRGKIFMVDEKRPFMITTEDIQHISKIGALVHILLKCTLNGLEKNPHPVSTFLFDGLDAYYRQLSTAHIEMSPTLTRVDLMIDVEGNWKIAEIDPSNKHGMGFALATRYESGTGEEQRLLSLLVPYVTDDVTIVLGRKDTFFHLEQCFFAEKLAAYSAKNIAVVLEEKLATDFHGGLILDFPLCDNIESRELLGRKFMERPESFINPPRHVLGSKALMTLPYEHAGWLEDAGMSRFLIDELKEYLPPTYLGPFVVKEVFSSGSKGIFFNAVGKRTVSQRYLDQYTFLLNGQKKFIRMACVFVGHSLAEMTVSADTRLPVHGGNTAVHYHVEVV